MNTEILVLGGQEYRADELTQEVINCHRAEMRQQSVGPPEELNDNNLLDWDGDGFYDNEMLDKFYLLGADMDHSFDDTAG